MNHASLWSSAGIRDLQEEINRMFEEVSDGELSNCFLCESGWSPLVNVYRNTDMIVIIAELAGMNREQVSIEISNNILTISGNRNDSSSSTEIHQRMERNIGKFERAVSIPYSINTSRARATMRNGLLRITLPVNPVEKPCMIEISGEEND